MIELNFCSQDEYLKKYNKKKIHFITYGDNNFNNSKIRLCNEAIKSKWFDTVSDYGPDDLSDEFKNKFKYILSQERGAGYWIWKCYIIKKKLNEINDNDILIYLDAGCTINTKGINRFYEYIDILDESETGIISFQMGSDEKLWTTKEIFDYFDIGLDHEIANSGQIMATVRIMKKNKNLINMIDKEIKALYDNPLMFTDYYNDNQNSYFIDNRHEQSIFSIIRKMHNPILLNDETYFLFSSEESLKYPFWATRIKDNSQLKKYKKYKKIAKISILFVFIYFLFSNSEYGYNYWF